MVYTLSGLAIVTLDLQTLKLHHHLCAISTKFKLFTTNRF